MERDIMNRTKRSVGFPSRRRDGLAVIIFFGLILASLPSAAQGNPRPSASKNVKAFGAVCNGSHDDSRAIQDALSSGGQGGQVAIVIPDNCVSGPLSVSSNQWIEFDQGATLHLLPGSLTNKTTPFLAISGKHDVTIKGNHSSLAMNRDEYTSGEWRAGVFIYESKNVYIEGLNVSGADGDGFTITGIPVPENITLADVKADMCIRNGISIISGRNIAIHGAVLTKTNPNGRGAGNNGPWAGLDIEPNGVPGDELKDIDISDVQTSNNGGAGLQFTLHDLPTVSINVKNFHSTADGQNGHGNGLYYGGILFDSGGRNPKAPIQGQIVIEGATVASSNGSGILWRDWSSNQPLTILRNTTVQNPGAQTGNMNRCGLYYNAKDSSFGTKYSPGEHLNIEVDGLVVKNDNGRLIRSVWFEGDAQHPLKAKVNNVQEVGSSTPRVQLKLR
jgi:hypothetical protein